MSSYVYPMMRGTSRIRSIVGNFLENHMPPYIDLLRAQNPELTPITLPHPKQYDGFDPYDTGTHKFPMVGTYFPNTENFNTTTIRIDGSNDIRVRYAATLFVTVSTPMLDPTKKMYGTREDTIQVRDDLLAAMRASILAHPSFGTASEDYWVVSDFETMREASPEPVRLNQTSPVWICSGLINIEIDAIETLSNPIIGTVETIVVDVEELP